MANRQLIDDFQLDDPIQDVRDAPLPIVPPPLDEVTPPPITADQDNYPLPAALLVRLSSDASRTFTGFAGAHSGLFIVANVGSFDVILAHDNAGSDAENRILNHSLADITLTPNQLGLMIYDAESARWRAMKGT